MTDLPLPPEEYRRLVGPTADRFFDNPTGAPVFSDVPLSSYASVFDFGCGCGRLARQFLQQQPRPDRYLGIDRHAGMIDWCRSALAPAAQTFEFRHHNVFHQHLNPGGVEGPLAFPASDDSMSLVVAWSVFTHLLEAEAAFYLHEVARVLTDEGVALTTWFLFDKTGFPMMQQFQNALFINTTDPTNAVIFDRAWLRARVSDAGLMMTHIVPPAVRGYQWRVHLQRRAPGHVERDFPDDVAPPGVMRAPVN
jgi:SAM-dependent methyltransferase